MMMMMMIATPEQGLQGPIPQDSQTRHCVVYYDVQILTAVESNCVRYCLAYHVARCR